MHQTSDLAIMEHGCCHICKLESSGTLTAANRQRLQAKAAEAAGAEAHQLYDLVDGRSQSGHLPNALQTAIQTSIRNVIELVCIQAGHLAKVQNLARLHACATPKKCVTRSHEEGAIHCCCGSSWGFAAGGSTLDCDSDDGDAHSDTATADNEEVLRLLALSDDDLALLEVRLPS